MHESNLRSFAEASAAYQGFEICEEPWRFYYDETENCRSISYGNTGIKDPRALKRDFILGGVMAKTAEAETILRKGSKTLPAPNGETKAKNVLGGSKDFLAVLKRKEVTEFLSLIDRPDVSVHYHSQNNLYYSIVDIIDSIIALPANQMMIAFHWELKDALYRAVAPCGEDFMNSLMRFGYPNITSANIAPFCKYIAALLYETQSDNENDPMATFYTETLRQMMQAAAKTNELLFLNGNPNGILVEGFSNHYQATCLLLPNAMHHFDNEFRVAMNLSDLLQNFEFVDSKTEPLIQLSDV